MLGGAGFLGANIIHSLIRTGHCITVVDRVDADQSRLASVLNDITLYKVQLNKTHKIKIILEEHKIDTVIHLVSSLLPSSSFKDYLLEYNQVIVPTLKLIHLLSKKRLNLLYLSSGGTVYGLGKTGIFKETDVCEPITYYGQSKKIIEEYIMFANRKYDLKYLILRPSNPYGRFQSLRSNQGFISVVLGKIINSEPIELWGDGSVVRDYIYISDFVTILLLLIEKKINNLTLNIGTGVGHSLLDVIKIVEIVTGKRAIVEIKPVRSVDIPINILDTNVIRELLRFDCVDLESGIKDYYRSLEFKNV